MCASGFAGRGVALEPMLVDALRGTGLGTPGPLVDDAHALGLAVHAFTFRDENAFLPLGCDGAAECVAFIEAGVDGLFVDHPRGARPVRCQGDDTGRVGSRRAVGA